MEFTEEALRRGLGQYAAIREAPVTQALNELRDQMKRLEAEAAAQGAGAGDDKSQLAMQQALNNAERIRREMEQLSRAQGHKGQNGQNGQKPGNQPGNGQQQGQQAGNGSQQGQQGQPGGQQTGGQQGQGQGGGQQQAGGLSPRGGTITPYGGGYGVNNSPRNGYAGPAGDQPFGATNYG